MGSTLSTLLSTLNYPHSFLHQLKRRLIQSRHSDKEQEEKRERESRQMLCVVTKIRLEYCLTTVKVTILCCGSHSVTNSYRCFIFIKYKTSIYNNLIKIIYLMKL